MYTALRTSRYYNKVMRGILPNGEAAPALPNVISILPSTFNQGETYTSVIITGTGFTGATSVSLGTGITVTSFTVNSDTEIEITAMSVALTAVLGDRDVTVTTPVGSNSLTNGIEVTFAFGNALQFDATNDNISRTSFLDKLNGTCTVGFWFKRLGVRNLYISGTLCYIGTLGNSNGFRYQFGVTEVNITYTPTWVTGTWYSVVVAKTTTNVKIYVNGVLIYNQPYTSANVAAGLTMSLTSSFGSTGNVVDHFFIKQGVEATTADALAIYNNLNGCSPSSILGACELEIPFNQSGSDATALDKSGNSFNFALNNFTLPGAWVAH